MNDDPSVPDEPIEDDSSETTGEALPEGVVRAGDVFRLIPPKNDPAPARKSKKMVGDRKTPPSVPPGDFTAPRRRLPAAERRELILAAAIDAFADTGYHQTSLEEVGRRAGVSKALIYEHFASKQMLYEELLETYVHELLERVGTAAISVEEGGEARLLAGVEGFLEFVDERRDAWRMLIRNRASDDVAELFERLYREVGATIGSLLAEEMPPSVLPEGADFDLVVEATSRQLLGSITAMANWWDEHRDVPRTQVLAMIMEFAWVGLERAASGERWTEPSVGDERA